MTSGFLRHLGLGRLWYRHYHRRLARFAWRRDFGEHYVRPMTLGEWGMILRACRLPRPRFHSSDVGEFACSFMTGHHFWHQTAFCAYSLARQWPGPFRPTFYDDGTLHRFEASLLRRIFPSAEIVTAEVTRTQLDAHLPTSRFPLLRALRDEIPMVRKLVDLRAASRRWHLYLDSDMLFFEYPHRLFDCCARRIAFSMQDTVDGYCTSLERVTAICGHAVIPGVNAGVLALDDAQIDWVRIERWCAQFSPAERRHILFEQTISAAILSSVLHEQLPVKDYRVLYQAADPPPPAVMLHYVHRAKPMYFITEWRRFWRGAS